MSAEDSEDKHRTSFLRRQKTMDAHMIDLSKSIFAKEELLKQLNTMQVKYEVRTTSWLNAITFQRISHDYEIH